MYHFIVEASSHPVSVRVVVLFSESKLYIVDIAMQFVSGTL